MFTITATAGQGGTIAPSGVIQVPAGGEITFHITADPGYYIADLLVDGVSVGLQHKVLSQIDTDHTVEAVFEPLNAQIAVDDQFTVAQDSPNNRLDVLANDNRQYAAPTPGMKLWLDASDLATQMQAGEPVSRWPDKSGNRNDATMWEAARYPLFAPDGLHGKPALKFDGVDDVLTWAALPDTTFSVFVVYQASNTLLWKDESAGNIWLTAKWLMSAPDYGYGIEAGVNEIVVQKHNTLLYFSPLGVYQAPIGDQGVLLEVAVANQQPTIWLNGALKRTGLTASNNSVGGPPTTVGTLGSNNEFTGYVAEVLIYGGQLSGCEREQVEGYLLQKYGLADAGKRLAVQQVPVVSTSGGSVQTDGAVVFYTPPAGLVGADQFTYVVADHCGGVDEGAVTVTVSDQHQFIEASHSSGGQISPAGTVTVPLDGQQRFVFTPDVGYKIKEVRVDGISIGVVSEYTFEHVAANHTLEVVFNSLAVDDQFTIAKDSPNNRLDVLANDGRQYAGPTPGMALWLNAETLTATLADGSPVTAWPDLSGKHYAGQRIAATQTTPTARPVLRTNVINGKPAVQFDGVDDWLQWYGGYGGTSITGTTLTMFVVCQTNREIDLNSEAIAGTTPHIENLVLGGVYNHEHTVGVGTNGITVYQDVGVTGNGVHYPALAVYDGWVGQDFALIGIEVEEAQPRIFLNGILAHIGLRGQWLHKAPTRLGGNGYGTHWFTGQVAEVLIYDGLLAPCDRRRVETYLAGKYGLPSPGEMLTLQSAPALSAVGGSIQTDANTVLYTPPAGFVGTDQFAYTVSDGCGQDEDMVTVTVSDQHYFIEARAQDGGDLSPSGTITVSVGGDQTVRITPRMGYTIHAVRVDGQSVGPVSEYTFAHVTANHTLEAAFRTTVDDVVTVKKNSVDNRIEPRARTWLTTESLPGQARFWLDAGSLSALQDGDHVARWRDQTPTNPFNDAVQTDPDRQPTFRAQAVNGKPAVYFDGINDQLTWNNEQPDDFTLFAVCQTARDHVITPEADWGTSASNGRNLLLDMFQVGSNTRVALSLGTNGITVYESDGAGYQPSLAVYDGLIGSAPGLLRLEYRQLQPSLAWNGVFKRIGLPSRWKAASSNAAILAAGLGTATAETFQGHLAEILVYDRPLTGCEIRQVEGYLAWKYGLPHPVPDVAVTLSQPRSAQGGQVTFDGQVVLYTPPTDYVGPDTLTYTFTDGCQTGTATVRITVAETDQFQIHAEAGPGGMVTPPGNTFVPAGAAHAVTITPLAGYRLEDVLVDGLSVGAVSTYTFTNMTADHTLTAQFLDIDAGDDGNGLLRAIVQKDARHAWTNNLTVMTGDTLRVGAVYGNTDLRTLEGNRLDKYYLIVDGPQEFHGRYKHGEYVSLPYPGDYRLRVSYLGKTQRLTIPVRTISAPLLDYRRNPATGLLELVVLTASGADREVLAAFAGEARANEPLALDLAVLEAYLLADQGGHSELHTFNLATRAHTVLPLAGTPLGGIALYTGYTLIGWRQQGGQIELIAINTRTGAITPVVTTPATSVIPGTFCVAEAQLDVYAAYPENEKAYFLDQAGQLYAVDLRTHQVTAPPLAQTLLTGVAGCDVYNFDHQGQTLIAYREQGNGQAELLLLNAATGRGESLGAVPVGTVKGLAVDSLRQRVYLKGEQNGLTTIVMYDLITRTFRAW